MVAWHVFWVWAEERVSLYNHADGILKEKLDYHAAWESVCPVLHAKQITGIVCLINGKRGAEMEHSIMLKEFLRIICL